ncbi:MAG: DUF5985 family protein [Gemmatimonadaceae bacterium]
MIQLVYVLCALTSIACAVLLLRGYFRTRVRLLLVWDENTLVTDLSNLRTLPALAGVYSRPLPPRFCCSPSSGSPCSTTPKRQVSGCIRCG